MNAIPMTSAVPDGGIEVHLREISQLFETLQVFPDGNVVYEFDNQGRMPLRDKGNWQTGADGTLTFIVQTVEGFKPIRVTPGPDNDVEAMLARGKVTR